jgi:glycine dehydrogenase subunit 1
MPYTPHTPEDIREMLAVIGLPDIESLFAEIPQGIRNPPIEMLPPLREQEVREEVARLAGRNQTTRNHLSFLGGGAYERIRPSIVDRLLSRSEFYTSYTPYQAEVSQGTLQYIFEFQSLITSLTGMEVANASMYDGASALAEAALMALRVTRKQKILYAQTLHPRWKETLKTYLTGIQAELIEIPSKEGVLDLAALSEKADTQTAAVLIQHPNFFGYLENLPGLAEIIRSSGAMWIQASDPLSLALLKPPGESGADIAVGELQSLGLPLSFGGPYAGYFAVRYKDVRQMPGRLVGKTVDSEGKTGYVLTLQTREQHIRRDKATSNICTNQSLCALAATIYMSLLGPHGLREVAQQNTDKAHYLAAKLIEIPGVRMFSEEPFFNEFTLVLDQPAAQVAGRLHSQGIRPGIEDARWTGSQDRLIVCVTETKKRDDLDQMVEAFATALKS